MAALYSGGDELGNTHKSRNSEYHWLQHPFQWSHGLFPQSNPLDIGETNQLQTETLRLFTFNSKRMSLLSIDACAIEYMPLMDSSENGGTSNCGIFKMVNNVYPGQKNNHNHTYSVTVGNLKYLKVFAILKCEEPHQPILSLISPDHWRCITVGTPFKITVKHLE